MSSSSQTLQYALNSVNTERQEYLLRKVGKFTRLSLENNCSFRRLKNETSFSYEFLLKALESQHDEGLIGLSLAEGKTWTGCEEEDLLINLTEDGIKAIARTL